MSIYDEIAVLREVPPFAALDDHKLKLLAFTSERLTFADGQELFHQGDVGDKAFIIMAGEADVLVDTPNGELKVATLKKNDLVGEIAILIDVPRTASVRAAQDLTTLAISKDQFFRMITEFPEMAIRLRSVWDNSYMPYEGISIWSI